MRSWKAGTASSVRPNARRAATVPPRTSLPCFTSPPTSSACPSSNSTENNGEPPLSNFLEPKNRPNVVGRNSVEPEKSANGPVRDFVCEAKPKKGRVSYDRHKIEDERRLGRPPGDGDSG